MGRHFAEAVVVVVVVDRTTGIVAVQTAAWALVLVEVVDNSLEQVVERTRVAARQTFAGRIAAR